MTRPSYHDFHHGVPPRIMGSETEYTTAGFSQGDPSYVISIPEDVASRSIRSDVDNRLWLPNGGVIYPDWGDVMEIATPECRSAYDVARYEKAGERLITEMARRAFVIAMDEEYELAHDRAYKRTAYDTVFENDDILLEPMSAGHHENYYTPLAEDRVSLEQDKESAIFQELSSYLVSRQIWAGAGLVSSHGYQYSQKNGVIDFESDEVTTDGKKTAFRCNEERLEIRLGDGNMSSWVIVQKFAFTSLVLRLIEHRRFPTHLLLSRHTEQLPSVASGWDVHLDTDEFMSAQDHQRAIAEACLEFARSHPAIPKEEIVAAHAIIQICNEIDDYLTDPTKLGPLAQKLDWAAKLSYLKQNNLTDSDLTTANLRSVMYDLKWEDTDIHSASNRWFSRQSNTPLDDRAINQAYYSPPNTRAKRRIELLQELDSATLGYVTWDQINTNTEQINLGNSPY